MAARQAPPGTPPVQPAGKDAPALPPPPRDPTAPTEVLPGSPAGKGILRAPDGTPREVPLMSIRKDAPGDRVAVGPVTPDTGVADVLLGSLGIVAVAVIAALVLGAIMGAVLVFVKHRLGWGGPDRDEQDHISLTARDSSRDDR